jgi:aminopeptidase
MRQARAAPQALSLPAPPWDPTTVEAPRSWRAPRLAEVDYDLLAPARRVIEGALSAVPGERVVIVSDRERKNLREALEEASRWANVQVRSFVLDEFGPRPLTRLPPPIAQALAEAQASIYLARGGSDEIEVRRELVENVARYRVRHAHMIGVTSRVMAKGLAVDPRRIADTARALRARLGPASTISVRSAAGSDLRLRCHPAHRWVENSGIIRPGSWLNLPAGELISSPESADGIFVCDASLTRFTERGAEADAVPLNPVVLRITSGRVAGVSSRSAALARRVEDFLRSGSFHDRVGIFSFGTNIGLSEVTGELLADQTLPGMHLALGMTLAHLTGASWDATGQLVLTSGRSDIDIDGRPVMRAGRYLL